jgi:hypothetical protein
MSYAQPVTRLNVTALPSKPNPSIIYVLPNGKEYLGGNELGAGSAVSTVPNFNRAPTPTDNTTIGITAAGQVWQAGGVIYETAAAPTATSASWQVAMNQGGAPLPVLGGSASVPFVGGTFAADPTYTGKAFRLSMKIGTVVTTQDVSITNGVLDVQTAATFIARADAGELPTIDRIYHQPDNTVFASVSGINPLLIVWDPLLQTYLITGDGAAPRGLKIPASVSVNKNNFGLILFGRGGNAADSGQTGCHYGAVGDNTNASGPFAGIAGYGTGGLYGSCGSLGNQIAVGGALIAPDVGPSVVGLDSNPSTGWTLWANEYEAGAGNVASSLTLSGGWIGTNIAANSKAGQFRTGLFVISNASVSATKRAALKRWVYRMFNALPQSPHLVVIGGDSRAMGTNTQYLSTPGIVLKPLMKSHARVYNIANGGQKIAEYQSAVLGNLSKLQKTGGINVYMSILDVNDINAGTLPDAVYALKQAEYAAAKAAGFKVVCFVGLRTTNGTVASNGKTYSQNLDALNDLVAAGGAAAVGADVIVDGRTLQSASTPGTATYYSDGIHQSDTTNQAIMALVAPAIDNLLAS